MKRLRPFQTYLILLSLFPRPILSSNPLNKWNKRRLGYVTKVLRGGDAVKKQEEGNSDERYSRQVYALGARAHNLVRTSTIFIDGPSSSGLLYECAKNLALSGVRNIVIVDSEDPLDRDYHNLRLDDLGRSYIRAACNELGVDDDSTTAMKSQEILLEYLQVLNPSVTISRAHRSEITRSDIHEKSSAVILCVDRPYETQIELNDISREQSMAFVSVETAGVYGRIFCDFGASFEVHDSDGETSLTTPLDEVELQENKKTFVVQCLEGERHDVSKGDIIQFILSNGDMIEERCVVLNVNNPQSFLVQMQSEITDVNSFVLKVNEEAVSFNRIKIPQKLTFQPIKAALESVKKDETLFTPCDLEKSFDEDRRVATLSCFQVLPAFVKINKRLPGLGDADSFIKLAQEEWNSDSNTNGDGKKLQHCRNFVNCCAAKLTPVQGLFGAIGAQEALKAVTGLYSPVKQLLLYDCDELLAAGKDSDNTSDSPSTGCNYILGRSFEEKLISKRVFVVGAGAIGCEILKNLAAMSVATGKEGCIFLTDMDSIEHSNLSRQFLFRDSDIGKFKSLAAKEAVRRINPDIRMKVHTSKVGEAQNGPFDDDFWTDDIDIVLNALDNVEARLYMDQQCVANQKAMVDAGTLGSKGNVQVVVPFQSESYGSSVDPPEPAIPVCTLKNFPYAIAHTIQWGRDLFDGLFERRPRQANLLIEALPEIKTNEIGRKMVDEEGEDATAKELIEDLSAVMLEARSSIDVLRDEAIKWAAMLANHLYVETVENLLRKHPINSVDEEGEPFWSGTRKAPRILSFSSGNEIDSLQQEINDNLVSFVCSAARLRMEAFMIHATTEQSIVKKEVVELALRGEFLNKVVEANIKYDKNSQEAHLVSNLKKIDKESHPALKLAEFEKDDDSNGHVEFVTAASNLRAICFSIPPVDLMETRRVAGKIIPAMITTTALVSALSCIEFLKLVQSAPLNKMRNAFLNLALPFLAFTAPLEAEIIAELRGKSYTIWDRITLKEDEETALSGGLALKHFLNLVKKKACDEPDEIDVSMVSYGPYMIYANFLHDEDKEMLKTSLWILIDEAITSGDEFDAEFSREEEKAMDSDVSNQLKNRNFLDLTVIVEDKESGEEVQLPPVRLYRA